MFLGLNHCPNHLLAVKCINLKILHDSVSFFKMRLKVVPNTHRIISKIKQFNIQYILIVYYILCSIIIIISGPVFGLVTLSSLDSVL